MPELENKPYDPDDIYGKYEDRFNSQSLPTPKKHSALGLIELEQLAEALWPNRGDIPFSQLLLRAQSLSAHLCQSTT